MTQTPSWVISNWYYQIIDSYQTFMPYNVNDMIRFLTIAKTPIPKFSGYFTGAFGSIKWKRLTTKCHEKGH